MVQRINGGNRPFQLSSMMGGMSAKPGGAAQKFSAQLRSNRDPDAAVLNMSDQSQTLSVLHKAFGGDVNGAEAQSAGRALGVRGGPGDGGMLGEMMKVNVQFLALQSTMEQWNRKGASMSNASKARHDSAMSSIRNMK